MPAATLPALPLLGADTIHDDRQRALYAWWVEARAGRARFARSEIVADALAPWRAHLALFGIERTGPQTRYRFMSQGQGIVELTGGDFEGRYLDEMMTAAQLAGVHRGYDAVARSGRAVYSTRRASRGNGVAMLFDRLLLPLGAQDGPPEEIVGFLISRLPDPEAARAAFASDSEDILVEGWLP